jgi:hypothetical protein
MITRAITLAVVLTAATTSASAQDRPSYKPTLIRGLLALRGHFNHVKYRFAAKLAREAAKVVSEPGNEWMPAHVLLGLAITESDLRYWLKRGRGVVADCGLTQINLTSLRLSYHQKRRLCERLRKYGATLLSMRRTMREMRRIRARYCNAAWLARIKRYHRWGRLGRLTDRQHFWRCALSLYNQGPRWLSFARNTCTFQTGGLPSTLARKTRYCRDRNLYWLRVHCFSTGVRLGLAPRYRGRRASCRRVGTMRYVESLFRYRRGSARLTRQPMAASVHY